jgi:hypothetical protein
MTDKNKAAAKDSLDAAANEALLIIEELKKHILAQKSIETSEMKWTTASEMNRLTNTLSEAATIIGLPGYEEE